MSGRTVSRSGLFGVAAALAASLLLLGCAEGERIPVLPQTPSMDTKPDPFFEKIIPLADDVRRYGGAWLGDDFFLVGTDGAVLVKTESGSWRQEDSGAGGTLYSVAAGPDGALLAVGAAGAIVERRNGGWARHEVGLDADLFRVVAGDEEAWAVGADGALVHRSAAGRWSMVDCPTDSNLHGVCARGDSLWVCGTGGLMLRRTGGVWHDESDGPWGDESLVAVAALEAGPVAAAGDTLYVRSEEGWLHGYVEDWPLYTRDMVAGHGRLWVLGLGDLLRLEPAPGGWLTNHLSLPWSIYGVAPRDSVRFAAFHPTYAVYWFDEHGDQVPDPILSSSSSWAFRLNDGTRGCASRYGVVAVGAGGELTALPLESAAVDVLSWLEGLAGASARDFYVAQDCDVHHIVDGRLVETIEMPYRASDEPLAVDDEGVVWIGTRSGLYRWDRGEPELELGEPDGMLEMSVKRTLDGQIVAFDRFQEWIRDGHDWLPFTSGRTYGAGQGPGGEILFLASSSWGLRDSLRIWQPGCEKPVAREIDLVPGVDVPSIEVAVSDESGFYVVTREPSWIFRLESDPLACRWEAVAGPFDGWLRDFEVLEDGSLLVFSSWNDEILLRRPH